MMKKISAKSRFPWYNENVARQRKRHVQQELPTWGGKRKGAGRPRRGARSSERHKRRPVLRATQPVHVVIRVVPDVGSLRRRQMYAAIREATIMAAKRDDFHIVHASIQGTHVHLLVEAQNRTALAKGMQGFQISAAKQLNRAVSERRGQRRRGSVFTDRYHARALSSPREVRNCIAYVLNNWRHHGEHRARFAASWKIDPYSSAVGFWGWKELAKSPSLFEPPPTYRALVVWLPKTWLLRESWVPRGAISVYDVPGPARGDAAD